MTGLVFVHLNHTHDLQHTLTIVDRLNIEHQLDLDQLDLLSKKERS